MTGTVCKPHWTDPVPYVICAGSRLQISNFNQLQRIAAHFVLTTLAFELFPPDKSARSVKMKSRRCRGDDGVLKDVKDGVHED
eukprot:5157419-Pyramimonas_sp.AAC.1